jgi:hypothetical protein
LPVSLPTQSSLMPSPKSFSSAASSTCIADARQRGRTLSRASRADAHSDVSTSGARAGATSGARGEGGVTGCGSLTSPAAEAAGRAAGAVARACRAGMSAPRPPLRTSITATRPTPKSVQTPSAVRARAGHDDRVRR